MAKLTIELDIPGLPTRAIEAQHIQQALQIAAQDIAAHGGQKHGRHDITLPSDRPGEERRKLGYWHFEPRAEA